MRCRWEGCCGISASLGQPSEEASTTERQGLHRRSIAGSVDDLPGGHTHTAPTWYTNHRNSLPPHISRAKLSERLHGVCPVFVTRLNNVHLHGVFPRPRSLPTAVHNFRPRSVIGHNDRPGRLLRRTSHLPFPALPSANQNMGEIFRQCLPVTTKINESANRSAIASLRGGASSVGIMLGQLVLKYDQRYLHKLKRHPQILRKLLFKSPRGDVRVC